MSPAIGSQLANIVTNEARRALDARQNRDINRLNALVLFLWYFGVVFNYHQHVCFSFWHQNYILSAYAILIFSIIRLHTHVLPDMWQLMIAIFNITIYGTIAYTMYKIYGIFHVGILSSMGLIIINIVMTQRLVRDIKI